jgi:hypothetical protein
VKRLTDEQYAAKLKAQGGGCAICGRKPMASSKRRYCQDHNHDTGLKRGLLCFICNGKILGRLERFRHYATLTQIMAYMTQYDPTAKVVGNTGFGDQSK